MPVPPCVFLSLLGLMPIPGPAPQPPAPPPAEAPKDAGGKPALQPLEVHRLRAHEGKMVIGATFSPDGKVLASAGWDNKVRLWDPETAEEVRRLDGHTAAAFVIAFTPDGKRLATGGNDLDLFLWDLESGKQLRTFKGHTAGTTHLAFTPDGNYLASGSYDQTCRLWNTTTGDGKIVGPRNGAGTAYAVAISPDGELLAVGRSDGSITLYHLPDGAEVRKMDKAGGDVWQLQFSPDGRLLASGEQNSGSPAALWEVSTGKLRLRVSDRNLLANSFSPDGSLLATGSSVGEVELWDAGTGKRLALVGKHDGQMVPTVVFAPDGSRLASAGHDGTLRIWKVPAHPPEAAKEPRPEELVALWGDLAAADGEKAHRAIHALRHVPEPTVRLMGERLRHAPLTPKADPARVALLIEQLDADAFRTRDGAQRELAGLGKVIRPALESALQKAPSLEARRRLKELLAATRPGAPTGPQMQRLRAVEVLEHLRSPGSRELLGRLAAGPEEALLTVEARRALERLARQGDSPSARER